MRFSSLALRHILSGVDPATISANELASGLVDLSNLGDDEFSISESTMVAVFERLGQVCNDPSFALRCGRHSAFTAMGAVGIHVSLMDTFRRALRALAHYWPVAYDDQALRLEETDRGLLVSFSPLACRPQHQQWMAEFRSGSFLSLLTRFAGHSARFERASFDYSEPEHASLYRELLNCELSFGSRHCAFVVGCVPADRAQPLPQPELATLIAELAREQMERWSWGRTIVDEVRAQLRQSGPEALSMPILARRLGMSDRSLRRKLKENGVDYRSLCTEKQRQDALHRSLRGGASVKEVAYGLGFSQPSAFSRAYERWSESRAR